jgi:SnoaL-like domain
VLVRVGQEVQEVSRGVEAVSRQQTAQQDVIARFVQAFNDEDLDALAATLDPHAEIQAARGLLIGRDEARRWATRNPGGELHQHLELEGVRTEGHPTVALLRRHWSWRESEEVADEEEIAALVTFSDGLIARWQPFHDRSEALAAAGIDE